MINSLTKEIDNLEIIFNRKGQLLKNSAEDIMAESLIKMGKTQGGEFLFYEKFFKKLKNEKMRLLEIGSHEGKGLAAFYFFLPKSYSAKSCKTTNRKT